jgi:hypothetical protein
MKFIVYIDPKTNIPHRYELPGEDLRELGPLGRFVFESLRSRIHSLQEEVAMQTAKRAQRSGQVTGEQKQAIFQADADRTEQMMQSDPAMEATQLLFPKEVHG